MFSEKDLKIGMFVTPDQLDNIAGIRLYLEDYNPLLGGKLVYFTKDGDDKFAYDLIHNKGDRKISTMYRQAGYTDEDVICF